MTGQTIRSGGFSYAFNSQGAVPPAHRMRAVLQARLSDELNGLGVAADVRIETEVTGLSARVATDGVTGLVANPGRRFPDLAASSVPLEAVFSARRYLPRRFEAVLGPFNTGLGYPADFPDHFEPVDLGTVQMHRAPVAISGRVMEEFGPLLAPLANVDIALAGIWSTEPGPNVLADLTIEAPDILSLWPGLYRDRSAATTTLADRGIVVDAQTKQLLQPADIGATKLRLSDQAGLVVGELVAIAPQDSAVAEYISITAIDGGLLPTDAATVTLAYPLARARPVGTRVAPAQVAPLAGAPNSFLRDGITGDVTAHLTGIAATLPGFGIVEISGDGLAEYQTARRYADLTGPDGDFALPPLSRVARIRIEASRADFTAPLRSDFGPDYDTPTQQLDFIVRP